LAERGFVARARSRKGLTEENREVYHDVASVVDVLETADTSKQIARLRPIGG